jgi:hypothetical protein
MVESIGAKEARFPFRYTKDVTTGTWKGLFGLPSQTYFHEYNVQLDEHTKRGKGENRYGKFTLSSFYGADAVEGEEDDPSEPIILRKTYMEFYDVEQVKKERGSAIFRQATTESDMRRIARALRIVFKDKQWELEYQVLIGNVNLYDVRQRLRSDPEVLAAQMEAFESTLITYQFHHSEIKKRIFAVHRTRSKKRLEELQRAIQTEVIKKQHLSATRRKRTVV